MWHTELQRGYEPKWRAKRTRLLVTSDGFGGVVICWHDRVQRIDSEGQFLWGENGIRLSEEPLGPAGDRSFDAVVTEKGDVIFVWEEKRGTILAQKISPEGEILWPEGGVQVDISVYSEPQITTDGLGGAIIAWRKQLYENGRESGSEVRAERIDAHGNRLWQQGGIVCVRKG